MTVRARTWRRIIGVLVGAGCGAVVSGCGAGPIDAIDIDPRSLKQDVIAYWSFDGGPGAGTTLHDDSGNNHDGVIAGATWITDGQFAGALRFSVSAVTVPAFPQPAPTDSWTVAAWVRPSSTTDTQMTTYATVIANELLREGGWEMNLRYPTAPPAYQFGYWVGPTENSYVFHDCNKQCVALATWTHVAAVRDATAHTLYFYRDGQLDGVADATDPIGTGADTLYMGRFPVESTVIAVALGLPPDERRLTGDLDDVVIYRRALGPGEVRALSLAPAPIP
jgi:hypothetical protein